MHAHDIESYILENFTDVHPLNSWGERSFFLNPGQQLKRGTYFATLKHHDGAHDKASFLNRPGIFRLNMGVSKECYLSLFQAIPPRPAQGECVQWHGDFKELDILLPHPIYAWMGWVCVLNPSTSTFTQCQGYLQDAYEKAACLTKKKLARSQR